MSKRHKEPNEAYAQYYSVIAPLIMGEGVGDGKTTACVMAQAATIDALRRGKTLDEPTDKMECCCPLLRNMAIRANVTEWWDSDEERTETLRPLIPLLLDSRVSEDKQKKRRYHIADNIIHTLTPMRLTWIAERQVREGVREQIAKGIEELSGLPKITDSKSLDIAKAVTQRLRAAASAEAVTYATAYASAATEAYADADADAYAYAVDYADAEQKKKYRTELLKLFREVVDIK